MSAGKTATSPQKPAAPLSVTSPAKKAKDTSPSTKPLPTEITQEVKHETVKKAAERFEKATKQNPLSRGHGTGSNLFRERSKSIGSNLNKKFQTDIDDLDDDDEDEMEGDMETKSILPWASEAQKQTASAVERKRNFMRNKVMIILIQAFFGHFEKKIKPKKTQNSRKNLKKTRAKFRKKNSKTGNAC